MLYLLLSIICATSLFVVLRSYERWQIKDSHGITFNYIFCVLIGLFFSGDLSLFKAVGQSSIFYFVICLGIGFILVFFLIAKTTIVSGVLTASIAMKLSFVIPVSLAIILYNDKISTLKILGILCAIIAVVLIAFEKNKEALSNTNQTNQREKIILPLIVFIGSGLCDATFNYIQKNMQDESWSHPITTLVFASACVTGIFINVRDKKLYQWKNVLGGLALGIPNYFSLYFLMKTLDTMKWESSVIFPVNNLGVVGLSAFAGILLFQERITMQKMLGFIFAVTSILIFVFI
ncbi:MAG: EamA/RhaT family transporter [Bacteroidetes bacterium]|nr:EamA/RhaT family transporter [Bacteroidota bacterium]